MMGPFGGAHLGRTGGIVAGEHLRSGEQRIDAGHRPVELDAILLDELHRGDRRDHLHHRGDAKHRVAAHRLPVAEMTGAEHPFVKDVVAGDGHGDDARNVRGAGRGAECGVDLGQRRSASLRRIFSGGERAPRPDDRRR